MYECKMKERGRGNEKIEGRVGGKRKVTGMERRGKRRGGERMTREER